MFDKIGQMKELLEFKKQADMMKREMEKIHTKVIDGNYEIVIRGDQHIEEVIENGEKRTDLEKLFNKAMRESQKAVEKKMKGQMAGLGFPGLK